MWAYKNNGDGWKRDLFYGGKHRINKKRAYELFDDGIIDYFEVGTIKGCLNKRD